MKICIVHPYDFNGEVGGTDIYVLQLATFLEEKGHQIFIVCPGKSKIINTIKGIEVLQVDLYPDDTFYSMEGILESNASFQFSDILNIQKPDIIHFHGFGKPYVSLLNVVSEHKIKSVLTPHISSLTCLKTNLIDYKNSVCNGKVMKIKCSICLYNQKLHSSYLSQIVGHSSNVVSSLFKIKDKLNSGKYILTPRVVRQLEMIKSLNDFDKIIVLNNWYKTVLLENQISIEKITTVKTSYKKIINVFNSELVEFQILFAGRKNTSKGLVLLLKSLKMAQFAFKVRLVICGPNDPNETKLILKLVNELKQKIQISVRDNIMHDELLKIVQKSHLVVLPSVDAEMCPLIILESQSNCIPVLGANHTGISDLIEEGKNGFLFKSSSMIDLKEKLEVLVNEKKLIHLNKILVDSKMDEFDFLEKHLVIYRQLLGN